MPECSYCGESFDSEAAELDHLESEHPDELGPIDRRRIGADESSDGLPMGPIALGAVLLVAAAVVGYIVVAGGNGAGPSGEPYNYQSVHYHGSINVTIDGQQLDFSRSRYQLQDRAFHFEGGNGDAWHVHAQGVTLQYAMATLGINITDTTVTFNGTTYRDSDADTTVRIQVNGNDVKPSKYVLKRDDNIEIFVRTGS